ncbi:reverse transcriptase domain-containing protein [Tanacetum coccineum]
MYLAASMESISFVLLAKRGKRQFPIYFISRTLEGADLDYPKLEKLILALVNVARRLQRYFQAYPIRILTNKPIKQIPARPEKSGRIAKWAIELGEHDIKFRGRYYVKGQILADFLAETPSVEDEEMEAKKATDEESKSENMWKLYTDGTSSFDGSEAGMVLVSPEGKKYTYALRFEFKTTNNEAEYDALLAGLRIATGMNVQDLSIFIDSQLVSNQVKGLFKARQQVIKHYLEKTREVLKSFNNYSMEHVRRE